MKGRLPKNLKFIAINNLIPPDVGAYTFQNVVDCTVQVPASAVNRYKSTEGWQWEGITRT